MQTSGNTILITGGTSGIGLAFAEEFLKRGNTVIICGRREERLQQLRTKHPSLVTYQCDVEDEKQRIELHQRITAQYPSLNILINNAGIQLTADLTKPVDLSRVRREIEINYIAPVHLSSLFASQLAGMKDSAIINITSGLAFVPIAFMPIYCSTKAALHSTTLSLRHQLKATPIKVFEIAPPSVDTELGHDRRTDKSQSHGGIPVSEFLAEAMEAIENDILEALVGMAKGLRAKGDALFNNLNPQ